MTATTQIEGSGGLDAIVAAAVARFGDRLRVASSFGVEDMVVIDAVAAASEKQTARPRVFLLDTGRLHQQTFDLIDRVRARYGLPILLFAPDAQEVEALVNADGPNGFYASVEARKACCNVRKVRPLARALAGAEAWMTGLRRDQSNSRATTSATEIDEAHGSILKINPLYDWSDAQLWERVRARDIPTHPLHDAGYPSIGCAPCTRAVAKGEHPRAGRWWWEDEAAHKECGLHPVSTLRVVSQ